MELAIFNACLYVILLLYQIKENGIVNFNICVILIYAIVSVVCVFYYKSGDYYYDLTLIPFLYLFTTNVIFFRPLLGETIKVKNSPIVDDKLYKTVAWVFIGFSCLASFVYYQKMMNSIMLDSWQDVYSDAQDARESTIFTKLTNVFFHLRYLGIVLFFSYAAKIQKFNFFLITLGIFSFLPLILSSVSIASRSGAIYLIASLGMTYLLFRELLPLKIKAVLLNIAIGLGAILGIYFFAVTYSRFDETLGVDSSDSFLRYFGHSMLTFNYGVMDTINGYLWGDYFFGADLNFNKIGTHFGSAFMTHVGCLYVDFGPIFTLIIAIIVSSFILKIVRKGQYDVPDLMMLVTFANYLFNGVAVMPPSFGKQWVEALIMYSVLKFFQRKHHL